MFKSISFKIIAILLLSLIGLIIFLNVSLHGNPYSTSITEEKVQQYLRETYPDQDFVIKTIKYDLKSGTYNAAVFSRKQNSINFVIWAGPKGVTYDEYKYKYLEDKELGRKFKSQIAEILLTIIKSKVKEIQGVQVEMYVPKGKYDAHSDYSRDMDENLKIYVYLDSAYDQKLTKELFLEKATKVKELVLKNDFKMEYFYCYYLHKTKGDGYSLELYKDDFEMKYAELINSKRLVDYKELNRNKGRR